MHKVIIAMIAGFMTGAVVAAWSQSNPNLIRGQVPTATQWNSYFSGKQDTLGFVPVNKAGDTMLGELKTLPAGTGTAGLNLGVGSAPSAPNNGDVWITSAGIFAQAGGSTVGPLAAAGSAMPGGSSGQLQYNAAGNLGGFTMAGDCTLAQPTITCNKTGGVNFGSLATLGVGSGLSSGGGNLNLQTPVTAANGGTGVNNGSSTISLGSSLTVSGSGGFTATIGGATNSTFPAGSHTVAALDVADQTITGGANVTNVVQSIGNITVDCGARPIQTIQNNGPFTITAPTTGGSCVLLISNSGSAGLVTFSGFANGANTGDALDTVNTHNFSVFIWKVLGGGANIAGYRIAAHQ